MPVFLRGGEPTLPCSNEFSRLISLSLSLSLFLLLFLSFPDGLGYVTIISGKSRYFASRRSFSAVFSLLSRDVTRGLARARD